MPQSSRTRRKAKSVTSKPAIQGVIEKAQSIDRRRQAQIANQVEAINRLLKNGEYGEEMKILHMAAAQLKAENDEMRKSVRVFLDALMAQQLEPNERNGQTYADALNALRTLIMPAAGS